MGLEVSWNEYKVEIKRKGQRLMNHFIAADKTIVIL